MKKILLLYIALLMCTPSFSQDCMVFKGIPVVGPVTQFNKEMKRNGFKLIANNQTEYLYKGYFVDKKCEVMVSSTTFGNVKSVSVIYDYEKNKSSLWNDIYNDFSFFVEIYTDKYGIPSKHTEKINSPYDSVSEEREGSSTFMTGVLLLGAVDYSAYWLFDYGSISIIIKSESTSRNASIIIMYADKTNLEEDEIFKRTISLGDI